MPGTTYSNVLENLQARAPQSSSAHRNTQRGNAGLAVTQLGLFYERGLMLGELVSSSMCFYKKFFSSFPIKKST